jgi:hypothetical protein
MKLIDRIAYISFWINILFILIIIILPVIAFNVPGLFEKLTANKGMNIYNLPFQILSLAVLFHWGYCIWFLYKYDRYSKSIIPLFFLNVLYAPIYYYRVKIKKIPLQNMINRPQEIEMGEKCINQDEFVDLIRNNVFGVIDLWASKDSQIDYQKNVPIAQVSAELFCQWEDFYLPDSKDFKQFFSKEELELLSEFDKALNDTIDKTPQNLPVIEEFIETTEWKTMNSKAIEINRKLNTVANNV